LKENLSEAVNEKGCFFLMKEVSTVCRKRGCWGEKHVSHSFRDASNKVNPQENLKKHTNESRDIWN
jgi:hypothetical protein